MFSRLKTLAALLALALVSLMARAEWQPGLVGGYVVGAFNKTDSPAETAAYLDPHATTNSYPAGGSKIWDNNRTWVYTGQIYLDGGSYLFAEFMQDKTQVKIDGSVVFADESWRTFAVSKPIALPAGWHDIELRFGHSTGSGGSYQTEQARCREGFHTAFAICREETPPTTMGTCSYPADPGDMTLFRHDDGIPAGKALYLSTSPAGLTPSEALVLEQGEERTLSTPETLVRDGVHFRCTGYRVVEIVDSHFANERTVPNMNDFSYLHGEHSVRVTWLYETDGYLLDAAPASEALGGSVSLLPGPDLDGGCYSAGTAVTVTATPPPEGTLSRWLGDADGAAAEPSIVVTMDRPRSLRADFGGTWSYDATAKTIGDGNWTLKVYQTGGDLKVKGVESVSDASLLDLRRAVADESGCLYPVISIGGFSQRDTLVEVRLPDTLETIEESAFTGCPLLETVTPFLPASLKKLSKRAFYNSRRLGGDLVVGPGKVFLEADPGQCGIFEGTQVRSADFSAATIEVIPWFTFYTCAELRSVKLPQGIRTIDSGAFYRCSKLATVTPFLPPTLTKIGRTVFFENTALTGDLVIASTDPVVIEPGKGTSGNFQKTAITSVDFSGATIEELPPYLFNSCPELTSVKLPQGLRSIGAGAFGRCPRLATVTPFLPSTLSSLGDQAFYLDPLLGGDLVIDHPGLVTLAKTSMNCGLFENSAIRSVTISSPVSAFPGRTFAGCEQLGKVVLPDSVDFSNGNDFRGCVALTNVTPFLPPVAGGMGDSTFRGCEKLLAPLVIDGPGDLAFGVNLFAGASIPSVTLAAPVAAIGADGGNGDSLFANATGLQSVTLPPTLRSIGPDTFYRAQAMTDLLFTGDCPEEVAPTAFRDVPTRKLRAFVPRFNPTWQRFIESGEGVAPLTEEDQAAYRASYPDGRLPAATWTVGSTKLWLHDCQYGETDAFFVVGVPVEAGDVTPAYGLSRRDDGEQVVCTAPANAIFDGMYYVCEGSVTETELSDRVWGDAVTNAGTSVTITKVPGKQQRLTWLWKSAAYGIDTTPSSGAGSGSVSFDPPSVIGNDCYLPGDVVTVTAVPAPGYYFRRWYGADVPAGHELDPSLTLTMDGSKVCQPLFSRGWTYDASAGTITDGNWVLSATCEGAALSIVDLVSAADPSMIDLGSPIADDAGQRYTLTAIGANAFQKAALAHLVLPSTLEEIGAGAFAECAELRQVEPFLPKSIRTIGSGAFRLAKSLEGDLVIGNGAPVVLGKTSANQGAFEGTAIASADLSGATIEEIPPNTFATCPLLARVRLPQGIRTLGMGAFHTCPELASVEPFLPETVTTIGSGLFCNCVKLGGDLVVNHSGPVVIDKDPQQRGAFEGTAIVSADLSGATIEVIPWYVFFSCSKLERVVLPQGIREFGRGVFSRCPELVTVTPFLPRSVEKLGDRVFYLSPKLTGDLVIDRQGPVVLGDNPMESGIFQGTAIRSATITSAVSLLPKNLFSSCPALGEATFPGGLEKTMENLFWNDKTLTNVTFLGDCPGRIESIFGGVPAWRTRVYVPRFDHSWEDFAETNTTMAPLTEDDLGRYRERYPTGPSPKAVWSVSSTKVWFCDIPYEGTDALYIRGEPLDIAGAIPGYGLQKVPDGETVTCTVPAETHFDGSFWRCTGSLLETELSERVWGNPVRREGNSVTFQKSAGKAQRLTWLWDNSAYALDLSPFGAGQGTVDADPPPDLGGDSYRPGTFVTLTARPAEGCRFLRWVGDVPEGQETQATIIIRMDSAKGCHPAFSHGWTYDASARTITDGNWLLGVQGDPGALEVVSLKQVSDRVLLDLSAPVLDTAGAPCAIASIGVGAFENVAGLVHLFLPDPLASIGDRAFQNCADLMKIHPFLPSGLQSIGARAFRQCEQIREPLLDLSGLEAPLLKERTFSTSGQIDSVLLPSRQIDLNSESVFYGFIAGAAFYFPKAAPRAPMNANWIFSSENGSRKILYGSLRLDPEGWAAIAQPLTDADRAQPDYPGPKTFGVHVDNGSTTRHWCVDWRSPLEPKGTILLLR